MHPPLDRDRLARFVARCAVAGARLRALDVHPLRGAWRQQPWRACACTSWTAMAAPAHIAFVVKRLEGRSRREAVIYEALLTRVSDAPAPRLLGVDRAGPTTCYLYLESIRPWRAWPWADPACAGLVLEQLAAVHTHLASLASEGVLADWDYGRELAGSAQMTLVAWEHAAGSPDLSWLRRALPALRRLVDALPALRRQLLSAAPFGVAIIHGDVHPGNVLIRTRGTTRQAVLLDWARTRLGSLLEDVSSWLQTLRLWEPEARRRHDTLLRRYLVARGLPEDLHRQLPDAYWLAAASNMLAGTLRYYVAVLDGYGQPAPQARRDALRAVQDGMRTIRRAAACWLA